MRAAQGHLPPVDDARIAVLNHRTADPATIAQQDQDLSQRPTSQSALSFTRHGASVSPGVVLAAGRTGERLARDGFGHGAALGGEGVGE